MPSAKHIPFYRFCLLSTVPMQGPKSHKPFLHVAAAEVIASLFSPARDLANCLAIWKKGKVLPGKGHLPLAFCYERQARRAVFETKCSIVDKMHALQLSGP